MGEITNFSITNGTSIVAIPVSIEENLDHVEKELNKLFTSLRSKYYLFVSDPVVEGIDSIDNNKVTIRISAETIPEKVQLVVELLEKKYSDYLLEKILKCLNPFLLHMTSKNVANYHWR